MAPTGVGVELPELSVEMGQRRQRSLTSPRAGAIRCASDPATHSFETRGVTGWARRGGVAQKLL